MVREGVSNLLSERTTGSDLVYPNYTVEYYPKPEMKYCLMFMSVRKGLNYAKKNCNVFVNVNVFCLHSNRRNVFHKCVCECKCIFFHIE